MVVICHEEMITGLQLWEDNETRTPAEQMAVDEALLRQACLPIVRFYRWAAPAVTFGYAQRYSDVCASAWGELPAIRRWTGGGLVFHGEDLTMALAVPAAGALSQLQTGMVYERIHHALLSAVDKIYPGARLAQPEDCRQGPACFQSPVLNDILHGEQKICGGALRRSRDGILYQGSFHGTFSAMSLAHSLSGSVVRFEPGEEFLRLCANLSKEKYETWGWNQMR